MNQIKLSFLITGIIFALSLYNLFEENTHIIGNQKGDISLKTIEDKLTWINKDSSNINGRSTPLIQFRANNGTYIKISVAEGQFENNSISPEINWKSLLNNGNSILLNSPDEYFSCPSGGINGKICESCQIKNLVESIRPGSVEIKECKGSLRKLFNIEYVANTVVVNFTNRFKNPDEQVKFISDQTLSNLEIGIEKFFESYNTYFYEKNPPKFLIVPSIGTGIGNVKKSDFYRIFFSQLIMNVKKSNFILPKEIILIVWRKDISSDPLIKANISSEILELYRERIKPENKKDLSIFNILFGISLGILILQLFTVFTKNTIFSYSKEIFAKKGILITIGLIVVAYGFSQSILSLPFDFINTKKNFINILIGFISMPAGLMIGYALKLSDQLTENGF